MAGKGQAKRKDKARVVLKTGECQRANGTYHYCWTDGSGKRHFIYAKTLEELREKEEQIEAALRQAKEHQGTAIIEFLIATEEIVLPMVKGGAPMSDMIL